MFGRFLIDLDNERRVRICAKIILEQWTLPGQVVDVVFRIKSELRMFKCLIGEQWVRIGWSEL